MKFKLKRVQTTPVMTPDHTSWWECKNVFNPSVIYRNGLFYMHYRAEGVDMISRIGYAVSTDGLNWNRLREPVLVPETQFEIKGVQDPRITEIDGVFYMAYCGWAPYTEGVKYCGNVYPLFAKSMDLINWERLGPMVRGEDNKDHMLFPRKFDGKFLAFHRRRPNVWLARSCDMVNWPENEMTEVLGSRPDVPWEGLYVGMNGVPIETDKGWLAFTHAADANYVYRIGVVLLDKDDPSKIINRPLEPILEPEMTWEELGHVPNVVFSNCNLLVDDEVYVYYGGSDHVIGLAKAKLDELLDYAANG